MNVPTGAAMGSKERREREKANTRQLILDAARELFVEDGYDAVSMRKIADKIEYSPTAIYVHFEDKDALLTELSVCDFKDFTEQFAAVPRDLPAIERLAGIGRAYVRFGVDHPAQYRHLFMVPRTVSPDVMAQKPEIDPYDILRQAVVEVIAEGRIHADWADPDLVAQLLWSGIHGVVALRITHPAKARVELRTVDELAEAMMCTLLEGLRHPCSTAPTT
jgi:AcrR family transcriptional regulator